MRLKMRVSESYNRWEHYFLYILTELYGKESVSANEKALTSKGLDLYNYAFKDGEQNSDDRYDDRYDEGFEDGRAEGFDSGYSDGQVETEHDMKRDIKDAFEEGVLSVTHASTREEINTVFEGLQKVCQSNPYAKLLMQEAFKEYFPGGF
jgi:hypothetical protein